MSDKNDSVQSPESAQNLQNEGQAEQVTPMQGETAEKANAEVEQAQADAEKAIGTTESEKTTVKEAAKPKEQAKQARKAAAHTPKAEPKQESKSEQRRKAVLAESDGVAKVVSTDGRSMRCQVNGKVYEGQSFSVESKWVNAVREALTNGGFSFDVQE